MVAPTRDGFRAVVNVHLFQVVPIKIMSTSSINICPSCCSSSGVNFATWVSFHHKQPKNIHPLSFWYLLSEHHHPNAEMSLRRNQMHFNCTIYHVTWKLITITQCSYNISLDNFPTVNTHYIYYIKRPLHNFFFLIIWLVPAFIFHSWWPCQVWLPHGVLGHPVGLVGPGL